LDGNSQKHGPLPSNKRRPTFHSPYVCGSELPGVGISRNPVYDLLKCRFVDVARHALSNEDSMILKRWPTERWTHRQRYTIRRYYRCPHLGLSPMATDNNWSINYPRSPVSTSNPLVSVSIRTFVK
jgi:hypothetical protein